MKKTYIRKITQEEFFILNLKHIRCGGELLQYAVNEIRSIRNEQVIVNGIYQDSHDTVTVDIRVKDIFRMDSAYYIITDLGQMLKLKNGGGKPTLIRKMMVEIEEGNGE